MRKFLEALKYAGFAAVLVGAWIAMLRMSGAGKGASAQETTEIVQVCVEPDEEFGIVQFMGFVERYGAELTRALERHDCGNLNRLLAQFEDGCCEPSVTVLSRRDLDDLLAGIIDLKEKFEFLYEALGCASVPATSETLRAL